MGKQWSIPWHLSVPHEASDSQNGQSPPLTDDVTKSLLPLSCVHYLDSGLGYMAPGKTDTKGTCGQDCGYLRAGIHSTTYNISLNNHRDILDKLRAKAKTLIRTPETSTVDSCSFICFSHIITFLEMYFSLGEEIYTRMCTHKHTSTYIHTIIFQRFWLSFLHISHVLTNQWNSQEHSNWPVRPWSLYYQC